MIDTNKEYISIAKEISKGVKWLFDKRSMLRDDYFENALMPLYNEIEASHNDFRLILNELENIGFEVNLEFRRQGNDLEKLEIRSRELMRTLQSKRSERQSLRPRIRSSAMQALVEHKRPYSKSNITLSEDENALVESMFNAIYEYLSINAMYAHNLGDHIMQMRDVISRIFTDGFTSKVEKDMIKTMEQVKNYNHNRELAWREIAESFGALKIKIKS